YTLEEIEDRIRRGESKTDWDRINAMTPEDIERLADEDDKRLGIDPDEWGEPVWVNGIEDLMKLTEDDEASRSKRETSS
ncbi:MAG: hypothetical protein ACC655_11605, partial [Rhodothermia bacterium]